MNSIYSSQYSALQNVVEQEKVRSSRGKSTVLDLPDKNKNLVGFIPILIFYQTCRIFIHSYLFSPLTSNDRESLNFPYICTRTRQFYSSMSPVWLKVISCPWKELHFREQCSRSISKTITKSNSQYINVFLPTYRQMNFLLTPLNT